MKKVEMKEMRNLEAGNVNAYSYFNAVKAQLFAAHKIGSFADEILEAIQKFGKGLYTINQFAKSAVFVQKSLLNFGIFAKVQGKNIFDFIK